MAYILLFLLRYILVALAVGILFTQVKLLRRLKLWSRFILGSSMTTVILPFITYLCALLWVGIPRIILFLIPIVLAFGYMLYRNNYKVLSLLIKEFIDCFSVLRCSDKKKRVSDILFKFIIVLFTIIYMFLGIQIFHTSLHEGVNGSDEAHYLTQGKIFYEDTNSREIDHYKGKYEGTVFMDDHGPLWVVYLADAVLIENSFDANAMEIKISYLFTVIAMLAMVINVGYIVVNSLWGGIFAIFLYFLYHYAFYFPIYGSRDGFRIVALLGLYIFLYELSIMAWRERNIPMEATAPLLFFSYLALNGHTGNIFGMFGITVVFLGLQLFLKLPFKQIVLSAISILFGTMLCFFKNIMRYVEHGRLNASELEAYSDTVAAEYFLDDYSKRFEWETIISSYDRSDILLVFIGLTAIVFFLIKSFKYYKDSNKNVSDGEKICAFWLLIGLLLPVTGVFNLLGQNVLQLFVGQLRYRMYFFVILALLGGMMLSEIRFINKQFFMWGIYIIIIPIFYLGLVNLNKYYWRMPSEYRQNQIDSLKYIAEIAISYATDGNVFVGAENVSVYFDEPPKLLYDYYARPILVANDNSEVEMALEELNGQVFVFYACDYLHYDVLPFYHYLQTSKDVVHEHYEEYGISADIYIVNRKVEQ